VGATRSTLVEPAIVESAQAHRRLRLLKPADTLRAQKKFLHIYICLLKQILFLPSFSSRMGRMAPDTEKIASA
jgi:hypothetical protein